MTFFSEFICRWEIIFVGGNIILGGAEIILLSGKIISEQKGVQHGSPNYSVQKRISWGVPNDLLYV